VREILEKHAEMGKSLENREEPGSLKLGIFGIMKD